MLAQDDFYSFDEDVFELSPFEVSSVSSGKYDPRYRGGAESTCPIRLKMRADIVTLKLTVSSSAKKPEERIENLRETYLLLSEKATANPQILFKSGYVALPMVTAGFFSSGKSGSEVSSFDCMLVAKLGPDDSIFDRMNVLNTFIGNIEFGRDVEVYFKSSGIGLLKPDQYREKLLELIGKEYRLMKTTFGEDVAVSINGLDRRVSVQQLDDSNLEVFIPYSMNVRVGEYE
jgi:hypothetical protein